VTDVTLLAELNRDVWEPFRAAYRAYDNDGYLALHTDNLIRVGGPGRAVQSAAEVAAETGPWFAGAAERGLALSIDFRFVERLAAGGLASERGIYRIGAGDDVFYGRFHTFCRQIDGRWRITVDYDSNDGTVDEAAFAAATALDDLRPYA
jgi:ketosteroid isomerase-like protein